MTSTIGAPSAHVHVPKADRPLNPAQQARAADPTAKGAAFGALVSGFAKAKHAPVTTPVTPPVVTPPAPTGTETATSTPPATVVDITA
jgi:hypothetical protein